MHEEAPDGPGGTGRLHNERRPGDSAGRGVVGVDGVVQAAALPLPQAIGGGDGGEVGGGRRRNEQKRCVEMEWFYLGRGE